ncbi:hypothetical protein BESB_016020 [Besnoitia besnoiti]|uniref:Uncharacterized protein n=1 Tax=Besnoitia besnoiti TaxID=94643 RepID=A0A2A9M4Z6_BESBE|nr:hypothetical protein BESB_016020 [Besnoitia besnoiti]PFH32284.1 hypothetical protein BESB_016020 [Besnoitia besnoiti]
MAFSSGLCLRRPCLPEAASVKAGEARSRRPVRLDSRRLSSASLYSSVLACTCSRLPPLPSAPASAVDLPQSAPPTRVVCLASWPVAPAAPVGAPSPSSSFLPCFAGARPFRPSPCPAFSALSAAQSPSSPLSRAMSVRAASSASSASLLAKTAPARRVPTPGASELKGRDSKPLPSAGCALALALQRLALGRKKRHARQKEEESGAVSHPQDASLRSAAKGDAGRGGASWGEAEDAEIAKTLAELAALIHRAAAANATRVVQHFPASPLSSESARAAASASALPQSPDGFPALASPSCERVLPPAPFSPPSALRASTSAGEKQPTPLQCCVALHACATLLSQSRLHPPAERREAPSGGRAEAIACLERQLVSSRLAADASPSRVEEARRLFRQSTEAEEGERMRRGGGDSDAAALHAALQREAEFVSKASELDWSRLPLYPFLPSSAHSAAVSASLPSHAAPCQSGPGSSAESFSSFSPSASLQFSAFSSPSLPSSSLAPPPSFFLSAFPPAVLLRHVTALLIQRAFALLHLCSVKQLVLLTSELSRLLPLLPFPSSADQVELYRHALACRVREEEAHRRVYLEKKLRRSRERRQKEKERQRAQRDCISSVVTSHSSSAAPPPPSGEREGSRTPEPAGASLSRSGAASAQTAASDSPSADVKEESPGGNGGEVYFEGDACGETPRVSRARLLASRVSATSRLAASSPAELSKSPSLAATSPAFQAHRLAASTLLLLVLRRLALRQRKRKASEAETLSPRALAALAHAVAALSAESVQLLQEADRAQATARSGSARPPDIDAEIESAKEGDGEEDEAARRLPLPLKRTSGGGEMLDRKQEALGSLASEGGATRERDCIGVKEWSFRTRRERRTERGRRIVDLSAGSECGLSPSTQSPPGRALGRAPRQLPPTLHSASPPCTPARAGIASPVLTSDASAPSPSLARSSEAEESPARFAARVAAEAGALGCALLLRGERRSSGDEEASFFFQACLRQLERFQAKDAAMLLRALVRLKAFPVAVGATRTKPSELLRRLPLRLVELVPRMSAAELSLLLPSVFSVCFACFKAANPHCAVALPKQGEKHLFSSLRAGEKREENFMMQTACLLPPSPVSARASVLAAAASPPASQRKEDKRKTGRAELAHASEPRQGGDGNGSKQKEEDWLQATRAWSAVVEVAEQRCVYLTMVDAELRQREAEARGLKQGVAGDGLTANRHTDTDKLRDALSSFYAR